MRIIYLGSPDFAIAPLEEILKTNHEVIAVITQPDKPAGRKSVLTPCDLKKYAMERGLNVLSYEKIRRDGVEDIKNLNPDIMVTCAYGQIISKEIIDIPKYGIINIHGSLLPKYRGASPIQWAIINGEKESGITIMQTDEGIDTGDIILAEKTEITDDMTAGELFEKLSHLGAAMVVKALDLIERGETKKTNQNEDQASFTKMIKKEDAEIDFSFEAEKIHNLVRGMNPWPVAYTKFNGKMLKVFRTKITEEYGKEGEVISSSGRLVIGTASKGIEFLEVQTEGGKRMSTKEVLLGHKIEKGTIFPC